MPKDDAGGGRMPDDQKPESSGGNEESRKKFARRMEILGIHPVLIFGISSTGKSMLLSSLVSFRRGANGGGAALLGEKLEDSPFYEVLSKDEVVARETRAQTLYNIDIPEILAGRKVNATDTVPFFLQLDTKFGRAQGIEQRIAFLEGKGELYELKTHKYDPMRWEIDAILRYFKNPISVLFVAPKYTADVMKRIKADAALENCILTYKNTRQSHEKDNLIFVVSKWDIDCTRLDFESLDGEFNKPSPQHCLSRLTEPDLAWGAFKELTFRQGARVLTPHAAAIWNEVSGEINTEETERHKAALDNFDRVIWDWLGENIFEQHGKDRSDYCPLPDPLERIKFHRYQRFAWRVLALKEPSRQKRGR